MTRSTHDKSPILTLESRQEGAAGEISRLRKNRYKRLRCDLWLLRYA